MIKRYLILSIDMANTAKLGKLYSEDMKGFSSFEADSMASFEEFDDLNTMQDYLKDRYRTCSTIWPILLWHELSI